MTTTGGSVVHQARFLPFGGSRGWASAPTTAWLDRGYTGHLHNDEVGLIYMNARVYVPSLGRFASADTLVPDPTNPQHFNRFSYVYNNPINLIDPSGHCGGDPNNHNLFDDAGNAHLDCTFTNFEQASIENRLLWIQRFASQNNLGNWFKNIEGIIQAFVESGLSEPGTWLSTVDAAILQAIQDGFVGRATANSGTSMWNDFFAALNSQDPLPEQDLKVLWGAAEQAATDYGGRLAELRGLSPDWPEQFFLDTGNIYRQSAQTGSLSVVSTILTVGIDGGTMGDWFADPQSVWYERSPVYWYSRALWWVTGHED